MGTGGRHRPQGHAPPAAPPDRRLQPPRRRIARHREPIEDRVRRGGAFGSPLTPGARVSGAPAPFSRRHIGAHRFRVTADGARSGQPTPEGAHRDGVTFVLMALVGREDVVGGETTVHDLGKQPLAPFTLTEPREPVPVNGERVFHGVSPVLQDGPSCRTTRPTPAVGTSW
ncbi:2OG-Fe dioxygenase family protein [Streptomyces sp. MRC013]|uniref:2OG-Fe dioxygenase family protein n=1 Tax=Streptomyces sp. MRC013 TaxID=2898276 RepID=UPI0020270F4B|nr:2OG-Fe dioxygenase family protein [Streptomyces sp. MRC013]URM90945.1 2OG-Fe dioxygenase family protein [Streptomyces sp. MRC013]